MPQKPSSNLIGWRRTIVCFWLLWLVHCCGRRQSLDVLTHNIRNEMADENVEQTSGIFQEIFTSPLNISLLCLCLFLLYKIVRGDKPADFGPVEEPLPKLKKRDFTLAELQEYDGLKNPRILMAISGKVFDVTRGKKFYGPGMAQIQSQVLPQTYLRWFFCAIRITWFLNYVCIGVFFYFKHDLLKTHEFNFRHAPLSHFLNEYKCKVITPNLLKIQDNSNVTRPF